MVFDSVCLVDMIVLGMFRADIGWFEIFSGEVSTKSSVKTAKIAKYKLFLVLLSNICHFEPFLEKISSKLRQKKFSNDFFHPISARNMPKTIISTKQTESKTIQTLLGRYPYC